MGMEMNNMMLLIRILERIRQIIILGRITLSTTHGAQQNQLKMLIRQNKKYHPKAIHLSIHLIILKILLEIRKTRKPKKRNLKIIKDNLLIYRQTHQV